MAILGLPLARRPSQEAQAHVRARLTLVQPRAALQEACRDVVRAWEGVHLLAEEVVHLMGDGMERGGEGGAALDVVGVEIHSLALVEGKKHAQACDAKRGYRLALRVFC